MFDKGPMIVLIHPEEDSKAPFVDRGSDTNVTGEKPLKKKASLVALVPEDAVHVDVQVKTASVDDIALDLFTLELRAMEKIAQPIAPPILKRPVGRILPGISRALFTPSKVAPAKPKPARPEVSPESIQKALQPEPSVAKGKAREIAYRRTEKGPELASPEPVKAPKGYEYLERREKVPFAESEKPFKEELRTPFRQALSKIPLVGKRLGKGVPTEFVSKGEYEYLRPKIVSGDIPRQVAYAFGRGVKGVGGAAAGAAKAVPGVGTIPAVLRAHEKMPLKERVTLRALEGAKGEQAQKARKELVKKLTIEPKKIKPELEQLPKELRSKPEIAQMAVKASEDIDRFKNLSEGEQSRELFGSMEVKGHKGGWRQASQDEIGKAVKEYRQKGSFPQGTRATGRLGEAHELSRVIEEKQLPEWATSKGIKGGKKVPFSAEEAQQQAATQAFMRGARGKGKEVQRAAGIEERQKFLKEQAKKIPETAAPGGRLPGGKQPEGRGKPGIPPPGTAGPTPTPKNLVPPSGGTAAKPPAEPTAKPVTAPKTLEDLHSAARSGTLHKVDMKDIQGIVSKEFHDPQAAAKALNVFIDQRQMLASRATRGAALGKGLDVAGGKPAPVGAPAPVAAPPAVPTAAPVAAPAAPAPAPAPVAEKPKIDVGGVSKSLEAVSAQTNVGPTQNMLYYAQTNMPPEGSPGHAEAMQRLNRVTKFHKQMWNVPPKGVNSKLQTYLKANPEDAQFFQGALEQYAAGGQIPGQVSMFQTGGPQAPPVVPKYTISAADEQARAAAQKWVKNVQKQIPGFDYTDPGQFAQAKTQFKMSPTAEKAFMQVAPEGWRQPAPAQQTFISGGPLAGGIQPTEQQIQAEQVKRMLQSLGYPIPSTSTVPGAQGAGLPPAAAQGALSGASQGALPGGAQAGLPADMSKRIADVVGGGSPELQAFLQSQGVKPGGGFMEGAMNMLPWFAVPMGLQAMGVEGILPQLAGYASIPFLQQKMQGMMGRDPEKIRQATQAYLAGQQPGKIPAPVPQG